MSESIKTGVPAFPHGTCGQGMSLRDYFAAKAMQSLVALDRTAATMTAEDAYAMADAMLAARAKP